MMKENLITRVDTLVLEQVRKFACIIQSCVGVNNFQLAKFLIGMLICLYYTRSLVRAAYVGSWDHLMAPFSILPFFAFIVVLVFRADKLYRYGYANTNRISPFVSGFRFGSWFWIAMELFPSDSEEYMSTLEECMSFLEGILVVLVAYLISVEPDTPSESKMRKLGKSIRSFFGSVSTGLPA